MFILAIHFRKIFLYSLHQFDSIVEYTASHWNRAFLTSDNGFRNYFFAFEIGISGLTEVSKGET